MITQTLTDNDIFTLKNHKKPSFYNKFFMVVFIMVLAFFLWVFKYFAGDVLESAKLFNELYIQWTLPSILLLVMIIVITIVNRNIRKDIKLGLTHIYEVKVEEKNQTRKDAYVVPTNGSQKPIAGSRMEYEIHAGGFHGFVNEEKYKNLNIGDTVRISVAPRSKVILEID